MKKRIIMLTILVGSLLFGECLELEPSNYGVCAMMLGTIWDGENCVSVSGCSTINSDGNDDSEYFYASHEDCLEACTTTNLTPGDINNDGFVNVVDVVLMVNFVLGITTPTADEQEAGDVNTDGMVNVVDIVIIVNWILSPERSTWERVSEDILLPKCGASCHVAGSFFAEQSDLILTPDIAYEQLIDRIPKNESAWADGLTLVNSSGGQPAEELSFLWEKINIAQQDHFYSDHPYYGELMPLGGPFLTNGELAFIKEWLHAGAPEDGIVADAVLLGDDSMYEPPEFGPLDVPEYGVQMHLDPFEIWDGYEREIFSYIPISNDEDVYLDRIEISMSPGSHHIIFYTYPENADPSDLPGECAPFIQQFPPEPYVIRDLHDQFGNYNYQTLCYMGLQTFFAGSQWNSMNYHFPPGVALRLPPNFGVDINSHFLNYSGDVPTGEVYGNFHFAEPEEVQHVADIFMLNNSDINLPPQETTTLEATFMFPQDFSAGFLGNGPIGNEDQINIFQLFSHAHERMIRFDVKRVGGENDGQLIYTALDWEHPPILELMPPLVLQEGEGLKLETTYFNNSNFTINFGLLGADEMMILFGHYYTD